MPISIYMLNVDFKKLKLDVANVEKFSVEHVNSEVNGESVLELVTF